MKRILGFAGATALLFAFTFTVAAASPFMYTKQLTRAKYPSGVCAPDSAVFTIEGVAGAAPTTGDTTQFFYVGNLAVGPNTAGTTNATPLMRISASGVASGVATDTLRFYIDLAMNKTGPWFTQAQNATWDGALLLSGLGVGVASDTTGSGLTKATIAAGSTAIPATAAVGVYSGVYALTSVTIGTAAGSPVGWQYARLRLTGDKTTGTINTLHDASVWVSIPVDVQAPSTPAESY